MRPKCGVFSNGQRAWESCPFPPAELDQSPLCPPPLLVSSGSLSRRAPKEDLGMSCERPETLAMQRILEAERQRKGLLVFRIPDLPRLAVQPWAIMPAV